MLGISMVKIVIFSDSHGSYDEMETVLKKENPDMVFFLGDGERDIEYLQYIYENLKVLAVRGNCDLFSELPVFLDCSVQGVRIFATHGHLYEVKHDRSLSVLKREGRKCRADVILFGHTHEPYYEVNNGIILLNPGTIGEGSSLSYGVLEIEDGTARGKIKSIKTE
ncbi:MAG: metallophosphoesterase [Oscillospiraceae bacterium]|nr:metallophosphoesterase [Oscillospiraceae bacterium]